MINFPIFKKLEVHGFGLYPGKEGSPGLTVDFQPGLTVFLGANGLGKTTLITILYRLLTGPYDIPALASRTNLGSANLQPTELKPAAKRVFARRVTDGAASATARLILTLGNREVVIERNLRNLELTELVIDGESMELAESDVFQSQMAEMVGVWSFGDWILLLRHMVFYFEDRRALVWDSSAQRQLLRLLLLPPATAKKWAEDERVILELDSRMRNLRFAVFREEQAVAEIETQVRDKDEVRQRLRELQELQTTDEGRIEQMDQESVELDVGHQNARLRYLKAQQERESQYREYEQAKLLVVESRFPRASEIARYILVHLFAEKNCLVCGNHVPRMAALLDERISDNDCVICGSALSKPAGTVPETGTADRRVGMAAEKLEQVERDLSEATIQFQESEEEFTRLKLELAELQAKVDERNSSINALIERLPPSERKIHEQHVELAIMKRRVEALTNELTEMQDSFGEFIDTQNRAIVDKSKAIQEAFATFAEGFMLETATLVWSPQRARVGQTGKTILFPAFELDMTGSDFPTAVRRTGPDHVSESQREFIDLAFRMSLMEVTSNNGASSLVIDAPESSLDSVFVKRAAEVLAKFASSQLGNRLAITSNLVEGGLLPELLRQSVPSGDRVSPIVDLFAIAEPTAAIRERMHEYRWVQRRLFASAERPPTEPPVNTSFLEAT